MPRKRKGRKPMNNTKGSNNGVDAPDDAEQSQSGVSLMALVEDSPQPSPSSHNEEAADVNAPRGMDYRYYQDILNFVTRPFSTNKKTKKQSEFNKGADQQLEQNISLKRTPNVERLRDRMGSPELGADYREIAKPTDQTEKRLFVESPSEKEQPQSPVRKRGRVSDIGPDPRKRQHTEQRRQTLPAKLRSISPMTDSVSQVESDEPVASDSLTGSSLLVDRLIRLMGQNAWTQQGASWQQNLRPTSHVWRNGQEELLDSRASQGMFQATWGLSDALGQHHIEDGGDTAIGNLEASVSSASKKLVSAIGRVHETMMQYSDPKYRYPESCGVLLTELKTVLIPCLVYVLDQLITAAWKAQSAGHWMVSVPLVRALLPVGGEISKLNLDVMEAAYPTLTETDEHAGGQQDIMAFRRILDVFIRSCSNVMNTFNAANAERDDVIRRERQEIEACKKRQKDKQMELFMLSRQQSRQLPPTKFVVSSTLPVKIAVWQLREDDMILSMIRSSRNPDMQVLARMLKERSQEEVALRAKHLKGKLRRVFERSDMTPPTWCYVE